MRGRQSAALLVVPPEGEPWQARFDLRVEDHTEPVEELRPAARGSPAPTSSPAGPTS